MACHRADSTRKVRAASSPDTLSPVAPAAAQLRVHLVHSDMSPLPTEPWPSDSGELRRRGDSSAARGDGQGGSVATVATPRALQHPVAAYLASLAPDSAETMRKRLRAVAELLGVAPEYEGQPPEEAFADGFHRLAFTEVEFIRQRLLRRGDAPATVNLTLAALKGVARYAWQLGLLDVGAYQRIKEVRGARGDRLPAGRALSGEELARLARACLADPTPAGARDLALLAVLRVGGLRRAEVAALRLADYRPGDPPTLTPLGKGNKERRVTLNADAALALARWLGVRGDAPGPLFVATDRYGNLAAKARQGRGGAPPKGITDSAVYRVIARRAAEAGVADLSPHDFRRTFVGDLLEKGHDLSTVQRLAGHASPTTTARYDRRGEAPQARATADLPFLTRLDGENDREGER
jgi:integrase